MTLSLRRAFVFAILSSITLAFAGCGKKLVGNTYKSGNGQLSISFSSDSKADVKRNGQEVDDCDYTRTGDTIVVKTRAFGDVTYTVQPDGTLKTGATTLTLKD